MKSQAERLIYGPAYLDLVMRTACPLVGPGRPPLDKSVDGCLAADLGPQTSLTLQAPDHKWLNISGLSPGLHPTGTLHLSHPVLDLAEMTVEPIEIASDLGGMGAGFAAALGGVLVSALGSADDPSKLLIEASLKQHRIDHRPVIVPQSATDWTLIVTSGPHGDKLPVGLRGCHARLTAQQMLQPGPWGVVVAASLPNSLLAELFISHQSSLRLLAPAMRNCRDRTTPLGHLAGLAELLCLNSHEWQELQPEDRQIWLDSNAMIAVTQGSDGAEILWVNERGQRLKHHEPVFPRSMPPVDTNRAGEAFAAFFLEELIGQGWSKARPGVTQKMIASAARAGAAAAGLAINMPRFGFPTATQLKSTLELGRI